MITYSIAGGSDQSKFTVTPGGVLTFNSPPDFEAPTDANGDNVYVVIVQASDGALTNLHALFGHGDERQRGADVLARRLQQQRHRRCRRLCGLAKVVGLIRRAAE